MIGREAREEESKLELFQNSKISSTSIIPPFTLNNNLCWFLKTLDRSSIINMTTLPLAVANSVPGRDKRQRLQLPHPFLFQNIYCMQTCPCLSTSLIIEVPW